MKYLNDLGKPVTCYFYRNQDSWQYGKPDKKKDEKYSKGLLKALMQIQRSERYRAISVVRCDGIQMFELVGEWGSSALFANVEVDEPYKNALGFMKSLASSVLGIYCKNCYEYDYGKNLFEKDILSFSLEEGNENEVGVINITVFNIGSIVLRISDDFNLSIKAKNPVKITNEDIHWLKKDIVGLFGCIENFKYSCTSLGYSRNGDALSMEVMYEGSMGDMECFRVTKWGEVIQKIRVGIQSRRG